MNRPRSCGTRDIWTSSGKDRRGGFYGNRDRGFVSNRDFNRFHMTIIANYSPLRSSKTGVVDYWMLNAFQRLDVLLLMLMTPSVWFTRKFFPRSVMCAMYSFISVCVVVSCGNLGLLSPFVKRASYAFVTLSFYLIFYNCCAIIILLRQRFQAFTPIF